MIPDEMLGIKKKFVVEKKNIVLHKNYPFKLRNKAINEEFAELITNKYLSQGIMAFRSKDEVYTEAGRMPNKERDLC